MPAPKIDDRILQYIHAAEQLLRGDYDVKLSTSDDDEIDEIGQLGEKLRELVYSLQVQYRRIGKINEITSQINSGLLLEDILNNVYESFREFIPYNRIGFALLEDDGKTVRSRWARTDQAIIRLQRGYAASLKSSSLEHIIQTGEPRILNDLPTYLSENPGSNSTRLIVEEGIKSSLTCPLIANGVPVGFVFFSSVDVDTYADVHIDSFLNIAEQLSVIVEKGRLVSEIAEQKTEIEKQNDELRELIGLKNSFLGVAAHDLRNPIAVIQMTANSLLSNEQLTASPDDEFLLQDIKKQTHYMLNLLNDLLNVSQLESGTFSVIPTTIEMADFLLTTVKHHNQLAESKGTKIILEPVDDGELMADPLRLRQVLDNLISNAVKFSPPNSEIKIRAQKQVDYWRIEVEDQGPGIKDKDKGSLFKEFARGSARPTAGEGSTGLGLAISRRVIDAHGGEINVENNDGPGATFWFTLPTIQEDD